MANFCITKRRRDYLWPSIRGQDRDWNAECRHVTGGIGCFEVKRKITCRFEIDIPNDGSRSRIKVESTRHLAHEGVGQCFPIGVTRSDCENELLALLTENARDLTEDWRLIRIGYRDHYVFTSRTRSVGSRDAEEIIAGLSFIRRPCQLASGSVECSPARQSAGCQTVHLSRRVVNRITISVSGCCLNP